MKLVQSGDSDDSSAPYYILKIESRERKEEAGRATWLLPNKPQLQPPRQYWVFADSGGRIPGILEHRSAVDKGFLQFGRFSDFRRESDMIPHGHWWRCERRSWLLQRSDGGCGTRIGLLAFVPWSRCAGCSVIGTRASSDLFGDQKNGLQLLWEGAVGLV